MQLLSVLKKDLVLVISWILALGALLVVRPGFELAVASVDLKVISLLFCLMLVIDHFLG